MSLVTELIDALDLTSVWTYLAVFLAASLLMIWRLEALLTHGLEGTALGTLVMPYCSGLGNLLLVAIIARRGGSAQDILTNSVVNNVTNLTLVLALPALFWGLSLGGGSDARRGGNAARKRASDTARQLNRLSLLLSLGAVLFFTGVTWALGDDGRLDRSDGLVLVAVFLFWQCFQVFDVLRQNVRQRRSFGPAFYVDLALVLVCAWGLYASIEWLVEWLSARSAGFVSVQYLGWLSGWLMVLPNALIALYYAARGRADVAFASQFGDGHICIPLCVGFMALLQPFTVPPVFATGLVVIAGAALVHGACLLGSNGLPRWMGWCLLGAYAVFLVRGLLQL